MSDTTLITNARVVNEDEVKDADVLISAGRIERVDTGITAPEVAQVVDAGGAFLLPGMIDDQVHFRDPGLTHKGDMTTESAAAVAGGITSFMDMPNVSPPTTTRDAMAKKYAHAAGRCHANYAFYFGATNHNAEEISRLQVGEACGVKVFMGASTGNLLVDDDQALNDIFRDAPLLVATHCEDSPMIDANLARWQEKLGDEVPISAHPEIRSAEACYKSSSKAVALAREHGTRLHVLHLTTGRELDLFQPGPVRDKQVTVEACVHHLFLDQHRYADLGNRIKCNPAIKTSEDRDALLDAVKADIIDVIATDHAPHTLEEKEQSYLAAPAGLPLVQHALLILLEHVQDGRLDIETVARKTSHAVAELFNIPERGFIREGYRADLTLLDMNAPTPVEPGGILYKCGWSPFEGFSFRSRVVGTFVNGQHVWDGAQLLAPAGGQRLDFEPR